MSRFFGELIKKIFEPAKDPAVGSDLSSIEHQLKLLRNLDRARKDVNLAKKQLQQIAHKLRREALEIFAKAKQAVGLDREDLARIALHRRQIMLREAKKIERQILEVEQEAERLALVQHRLTTRLEAYATRRDVLSARQSAAEAQVAAGEAMGGLTEGSEELNRALELAERNRENIQARVEAIDELIRSGEVFTDLEGRTDSLIEQELRSLKKAKKHTKND